jgi:hypothetical protein
VPKPPDARTGRRLLVGNRRLVFSFWPTSKGARGYVLQPEVLTNSPWDVIEYRIKDRYDARSKSRKICLSFLEQAKNFYFASQSTGASSRPLLLYYSFLNLAKAYILYQGKASDLDRAAHGVSEKAARFDQAKVKVFRATARDKNVVDLFGQALGEKPLSADLSLKVVGHLFPQIVIGHRLWAAASGKTLKFFRCELIEFRHDKRSRQIWLRVCITRDDLRASTISHRQFARLTRLDTHFKEVSPSDYALGRRCVVYEQKTPVTYSRRPSDKLHDLVAFLSPHVWPIVRSMPPYRRYYLNLLSPLQRRVNPLIAIYLICFYLGSVTRYRPHEFEKIQDSKYGMFVAEFLETEGLQFWYKMACEFSQQSVSSPAVVH